MVYDEWQAPDYPIYMKYYMYTYNNAQDLVDGTDPKPEVEQVGVLSYRLVCFRSCVFFKGIDGLEMDKTRRKNIKVALVPYSSRFTWHAGKI